MIVCCIRHVSGARELRIQNLIILSVDLQTVIYNNDIYLNREISIWINEEMTSSRKQARNQIFIS